MSLAVVGTFGTAAVTGLASVLLFDLRLLEGLLLGSILAASDGAAVFALLRGANLPPRVARTLEGKPASTTRSPCCSCSPSLS